MWLVPTSGVMRFLALASLVMVAACDTFVVYPRVEAEGVSLDTDGPDDGDRSTIGLVLRNEGTVAVEAEACASVEERVGDEWTAERRDGRACDLDAVVLDPGESRVEQLDTGDLPNGTYRFVQETSVGTVASTSLKIDR